MARLLRGAFVAWLLCMQMESACSLNAIFWASEPVRPGELVLLGVTGMTNTTSIEVKQGTEPWAAVSAEGITAYGCAISVPTAFKYAEFEVRANGGNTFIVNRPRPWYLFGDAGDSATPGGWLRVVGEAISLDPQTTSAVMTLRGSTEHILTARKATPRGGDGLGAAPTRWHAFFDVPSNTPTGYYEVMLGNSADGTLTPVCTFIASHTPCFSGFNISIPMKWKTKQFTVNAPQPGPGRNATDAVLKAIAAATANGGGIVYFPRGMYFVDVPLIVTPGTVIRGEASHLTSIYFKEANASTAPPAYVSSAGPGSWGIEKVTLYVTAYANNVVQFQPGTNTAFMRSVTIRYNSYFSLEPVTGQGARGRTTSWSHDVGTAVKLAGKNIFVTDNDIFSSGDVVSTLNNGAAGAEYMHVARNRMWNGGTTHWGISWKQCIYEDNVATGVSTTAMGSNYPQYAHDDGAPHVQHIYHHNNSQNLIWGNDREMMTCDGGGGVYYGGVEGTNSTTVTLSKPAEGFQPGGAFCVIEGTNTGNCRRVVSTASKLVFELDSPFPVPLDSSSRVTIIPFVGHIAFNGNNYTDGGAVQFYAQALGCVAAENRFRRTGGLSAWARQAQGDVWGPNQRMSFIDNEVLEGNHAWNYNTFPNPSTDPDSWPYFPGGSKTIEPWSIASLTDDQGPPTDPGPEKDFQGGFNRFIVFRGNKVHNNGGILVRGTSANVIVESNIIEDSDVGIHVNTTTTQGGIVVRANTEPPAVAGKNFNPYSPSNEFGAVRFV